LQKTPHRSPQMRRARALAHTHAHIHTHIHTHARTHIYTYKLAHTHTHTRTCKHTYTHANSHEHTHTGIPKVMHYGLLFSVDDYQFDKHWHFDFDVTKCPPWVDFGRNSKAGIFEPPPWPKTIKSYQNKVGAWVGCILLQTLVYRGLVKSLSNSLTQTIKTYQNR